MRILVTHTRLTTPCAGRRARRRAVAVARRRPDGGRTNSQL